MTYPIIEKIERTPTPTQLLGKLNELCEGYNALASFCIYVQCALFTEVTANPFTVTFDTMDGISATGIWNKGQNCIEF